MPQTQEIKSAMHLNNMTQELGTIKHRMEKEQAYVLDQIYAGAVTPMMIILTQKAKLLNNAIVAVKKLRDFEFEAQR